MQPNKSMCTYWDQMTSTQLYKKIMSYLALATLQSLTGKLQGRISTQGDPCSHYRE